MSEKEKEKQGFFSRFGKRITKFFREMRSELKKVVWPGPKQLVNNTGIVLISVAVVGAVVAGLDFVFTWATSLLYNLL